MDTGERSDSCAGNTVMTYTYGNPKAKTVLIQMVDDHDLAGMESEVAEITKLSDDDFCLFAIKVQDWNDDLSPWNAPAVFGKEGFGQGASNTLAEVLKYCDNKDKAYIIGGYSLAGLFALWTAYQTDAFTAVAAASPSIWFPGFLDFMKENAIHVGSVYLSLGDREEKVRNPVMASVGERIREAYGLLKAQDVNTTLEWNQGNHFKDADIRTAKAFAWVISDARKVEPGKRKTVIRHPIKDASGKDVSSDHGKDNCPL